MDSAASLPTMLVVDDEEGPRTSLRMVFKSQFSVHTFDNSAAAIEFVHDHAVHVAVLDLRIGNESGLELLRQIKEVDPRIEVIMLTAQETLDTAKEAMRQGACDYLSKPFDLRSIREAVGRAHRLRCATNTIEANTERLKSLTEQLHESFSREEMTRTANEIYAGVIHDLNNPLAIISGFVDVLHQQIADAPQLEGKALQDLRQHLQTIGKQVNTCCEISSRYLRFMSKVGRGPQRIPVNQVLTDLEQLLRNHPALKGNILAVDQLAEDVVTTLQSTELLQALLNLAVNAFQSTDAPQTIHISAELHSRPLPVSTYANTPELRYVGLESLTNTAPFVALSVSDQGSGIPPPRSPPHLRDLLHDEVRGARHRSRALHRRPPRALGPRLHPRRHPARERHDGDAFPPGRARLSPAAVRHRLTGRRQPPAGLNRRQDSAPSAPATAVFGIASGGLRPCSPHVDWLLYLACAALGATIALLYQRARESALRVRILGTEAQFAETRTALDSARAELERLRTLAAERETAAARLAATLDSERQSAAEKLAVLQEAQNRLTTEFKALSSEALKSNNQSFLELAKATLAQFQEGAKGDLAQRQQAIDSLVKPIRESLEKVDVRIGEIEKTRVSAYSALSEQLKSLASAQGTLQSETTRLATALSGTRTAGTWGELQLRRVVELAGMVEHCDFSEQTVSDDRKRPDLVVRLPRGQIIAIDAKAPTDAFREAAVAADPAIRTAKLAEHAAKVRGHIDALAARAYWEQFTPSPEFVVLFLPGDQFLSAALEADPAIVDRGINSRVLLATPSTLVALLKAAAYGWRQEAVSQNAEAIAQLGRELYDRVVTFAEHLEKAGRGLEQATAAYNKAVGSFEGTLLPGARKFVELGARGTKELPELGGVETTVRDLARRS